MGHFGYRLKDWLAQCTEKNHLTRVQYVEPQEYHNFSRHYIRNPSTSDIS